MRIVTEEQKARALAWWEGRSRREQYLLGALAGLVLLWLFFVAIAQPLWTARSEAIANIRTYENLTARLRQAGTLTGKITRRDGSPASILSASATEFGLAPMIMPDADRYRVTLTDAPYDAVLRWVVEVERSSHLRFVGMRLERRPMTGLISAQLQVRG